MSEQQKEYIHSYSYNFEIRSSIAGNTEEEIASLRAEALSMLKTEVSTVKNDTCALVWYQTDVVDKSDPRYSGLEEN